MFEIGASLREARTRQGLDFTEMEHRTKVRAKYLRLLEEEAFDQLPAHTYIKGFLRTYAEALGLDGGLYVDEYNSRFVVGEDETHVRARRAPQQPLRTRSRRRERRESRVVVIALAGIVLVTALVIAAWKFGGPGSQSVHGLSQPPAATTRPRQPAAIVVRAVHGASFLEVRAVSRGGKPLFQGTLLQGEAQRFGPRALWLSITSPRNVVVTVFGHRLSVPAGGQFQIAAPTRTQ
ncbi:MAG TPA: helix-turn-helix domain-containing protein [Gaiellaceae bacterium]|nr:helix-turn-helix domain-containing protein [Gaiellaceae bacterium]